MTHCTLAVIGHVDHGKTALVRALTGIETDRLKEEQQRGLSIALGFAWLDGPVGGVDIIDAPGHEDFIRTMTAGAAGARAVLLVVSAVDGFERQTFEHLQIATLLGIRAGVVAVTKSDLLSPDEYGKTASAVDTFLAGTPLRGQPIVFCSARTGAGLDALKGALDDLPRRCAPPVALPGFYLPIDRVFTVRGAGTVVTGTLAGGPLRVGDTAVAQPSGQVVTIRGLQARGVNLGVIIEPGRRAAVNIRGAAVEDVHVGDVLCARDHFAPSRRLDVRVTLTADGLRPLKHLDEVRLLLGTRAAVATARVLDGRSISPGESGWVQFRFDGEVVAHAGQLAVLRRLSPPETIGGAVVFDPAPSVSGRRNAGRVDVLQAVVSGDALHIAFALAARDAGLLAIDDVARLAHLSPAAVRARLAEEFDAIDDRHLASRRTLREARQTYLSALSEAHRVAPAKPGVPLASIRRAVVRATPALVEHVEGQLAKTGEIILANGQVALASHDPIAALGEDARARLERIEALLCDGGAAPPDPSKLIGADPDGAGLVELLVATGRAVALENFALRKTLLFHPAALRAALETLAAAFPPATLFKTGEARELLATSRKFIVPLLEYFDARGWTLRTGDLRRIAPG